MNSRNLSLHFLVKTCPPGKGLILDENENCVCPPGYAFDDNGNCIPCPSDRGFIIDSNGKCVCDSSKGLVLDPTTKRCVCPPGKELDQNGFCVDSKFNSHLPFFLRSTHVKISEILFFGYYFNANCPLQILFYEIFLKKWIFSLF
jgi:hypothetical protein